MKRRLTEITLNLRSQSLRKINMKLSVEDYAYDLKKSFEKRNEYIQLFYII